METTISQSVPGTPRTLELAQFINVQSGNAQKGNGTFSGRMKRITSITQQSGSRTEQSASSRVIQGIEFGPWRHYNAVTSKPPRYLPKIHNGAVSSNFSVDLTPRKARTMSLPNSTNVSGYLEDNHDHRSRTAVPYAKSTPLSPQRKVGFMKSTVGVPNSANASAYFDDDSKPTTAGSEAYVKLTPTSPRPTLGLSKGAGGCMGCLSIAESGPEGQRWADQQKHLILDQYLAYCAHQNRPSMFRNQLQYFLNDASAQKLDLSQAKAISRDIYTLIGSLAGMGPASDGISERTSIHAINNHLEKANLTSLNISNNRLGTDSLDPLAAILIEADFLRARPVCAPCQPKNPLAALTELDISENRIGSSGCFAIRNLLRADNCALRTLIAYKNSFQDMGCAAIADALCSNTSLVNLNLTENDAAKNAGTALGCMLKHNQSLTALHLNYNHLRYLGAQALCQGLAHNTTLRELTLQWNGFGDEDTLYALARALPVCGLTSLSLAHNRISPKGSSILVQAIEAASKLRRLNLDGNPIGAAGARAIVRANAQQGAGGGGDGVQSPPPADEPAASSTPSSPLATGEPTADVEFALEAAEVSVVSSPVYGYRGTLGGRIGILRTCTGDVGKSQFDPSEPSGDYELDLKEPFYKSVLFKLIQIQSSGKGAFVPLRARGAAQTSNGVLQLSSRVEDVVNVRIADNGSVDRADWCLYVEDPRCKKLKLPLDEEHDKTGNHVPMYKRWALLFGRNPISITCILRFNYQDIRKSATLQDRLPQRMYETLQAAFTAQEMDFGKCADLIDVSLGSGVFINLEQTKMLLELLGDSPSYNITRREELSKLRVVFMTNCFHKIVEVGRNKDLLDLLPSGERAAAEKMLGMVSLEFTPNNPTGFHKLDMGNTNEREIFFKLLEMKNDMETRVKQMRNFYSTNRFGGKRDLENQDPDLQRIWRNARHDGKRFEPNSRVPRSGIFQVDFVMITMPDIKEGYYYPALSDREFDKMLKSLEDEHLTDIEKISLVRRLSNEKLFSCRQLSTILSSFTDPNYRVEVCVIGYSRLIDWHGYKNVIIRLYPEEYKVLERRIGGINLFDDVMAVGRYDLDLARSAHRFIMQELVHLASIEPGYNLVSCTYKDLDFDVPQAWLNDVPRSGVISFYYCREQAVIEKIFETGSWDGSGSVYHMREDGRPFGKTSWSTYVPNWLAEFCKPDPKGGPVPCSQPAGQAWVMALKIRYIKLKMMEKFNDPRKLFDAMDKDGGGSLERKEIASGLYQLGMWLHPKELAVLLDTLDADGGGDVDFEEFKIFWDTFNLD